MWRRRTIFVLSDMSCFAETIPTTPRLALPVSGSSRRSPPVMVLASSASDFGSIIPSNACQMLSEENVRIISCAKVPDVISRSVSTTTCGAGGSTHLTIDENNQSCPAEPRIPKGTAFACKHFPLQIAGRLSGADGALSITCGSTCALKIVVYD